MRILDRYVTKSVVSIFISCIFTFLFLYTIIDLLSRLEDVLKLHIGYMVLVKYYVANLPIMFGQVAPFACLLATIYTFSKLNHDNEIIAMRAAGMSIFNITRTVIVFGFIISLFMFWLNDRVVPSAMAITQQLQAHMDQSKRSQAAAAEAQKKHEAMVNLTIYGARNRLFFINKYIPSTSTMEGVTILEHDNKQNIVKKIVANKGVFSDNLWKFYQCVTYDFDSSGQIVQEPQYFEEEIMTIPEGPADFIGQRNRPDYMTIRQLQDYIYKLSRSGATTLIRNLKLDLYQRFTSALTCLIIVLLGIPFSMMVRKRATGLSSIGISIMVGCLYYVGDAIFIAFGRGGMIMPSLAVSATHIIAFSYGIYLIRSLP